MTESTINKKLLHLLKLICVDVEIKNVNNIPFVFVCGQQRYLITEEEKKLLTEFKSMTFEEFKKL